MPDKIVSMRRHFTSSKLHELLSKDERTKFLEEILSTGEDTKHLLSIIKQEETEDLEPESVLVQAFAWDTSLYGEGYWKAIYARVASERVGTKSKDDVVKSNISAATFDKMRDTLEMYLTSIGYRHKSLHDDDRHIFVSKDRKTQVSMNNGYIHVLGKPVTAHSILYSEIQEMSLVDYEIIITLKNGCIVTITGV